MGATLGYVNVITKNVVNLIYTPILIRMLGQGDYGVFQMTNSVVMALSVLSMGFDSAYVRFYSQRKAKHQESEIRKLNGMYLTIFMVMAVLCLICGLVLFANVNLLFSKGLNAHERGLAKTLIGILIFNVAITFPGTVFDSYIMVHEQFIFQQTRQLFTTLAVPVLAVSGLFLGFGAVGVALAQAIMTTILLILNINYACRKLGMKFDFHSFDVPLFKSIAIFSFWIFLNQLFDMVNNNVPNFLLGAMASAKVVAVFSVAIQIRNIFFMMSTTMSNVFIPKINNMVVTKDDNEDLTHLMTKVGRYQMILFCLLYGGFVLVGRYFIRVWAGPSFDDAYWMILIMTLPVMIPLTQNTGIEIQRAKNKHKVRSCIYILTSVIDVVISVVLIPKYGYWATTWGYVVSIVLGTGLFMNWYYQFRIGLNMVYFWKKMLPSMGVGIATLSICELFAHLTRLSGLTGFLVNGFLYVFIYVVAIWLFIMTSQEKSKLLRKHEMKA
ncbi:oligosaccharide flippase family protein [Bifidobacterium sp. ESL0690]|uniref:lipopolysaccharide biosynthesis protein n=1 Tax=Bifidobacterium sp. ESL0690 TaxID=2983214 RepID=UPI0023FA0FF9|nr:oligosaccharide flippase family protein [Bifidobacterium sp. ESL0690]WEV47072.1 oligosaccharide flippase family protein [Bifidobacterium sp. ESL0690]